MKFLQSLPFFARFAQPAPTRRQLTQELATRPQQVLGQMMALLPNPDEVLRKAGKSVTVYENLLADGEVFSAVNSFKSGVKALDWKLSGEGAESPQADALRAVLERLDMPRIIGEMLDGRLYGYQPLEIIWERRPEGLLPADVVGKPAGWFSWNTDEQLCLNAPAPGRPARPVPDYKFLVARNNASYNNPYGQAVLSRVFWPVSFKRGGLKFWLTFTEKYGMPWAVGKRPRGAQPGDTDKLLDELERMVADAIAVIPDDSSVELHPTGSSANVEIYRSLIRYCDGQINKVILSQTLTGSDGEGSGSYALGKVHEGVRHDVILEGKRLVEAQFNRLITWVWQLNRWSGPPPQFRLFADEEVDKPLAERDEILSRTGVQFTKAYYQKTYGLAEEDFELSPPQPAVPAGFSQHPPGCRCGCQTARFSSNPAAPPDAQQQTDTAIETLTGPDRPETDAFTAPARQTLAIVQAAETPEQALAALAEAYPGLDTNALEERLTRALFVARLWGRLTEAEDTADL